MIVTTSQECAVTPPNQAFQPTSSPPGLRPSGKAAAELGCWAARIHKVSATTGGGPKTKG